MTGLVRSEGIWAGQAAGGGSPGALPAWAAIGTVLSSATLPGTRDVAVPAHSAGDLLLLTVSMRNNEANGTLTAINTSGWTIITGASAGAQVVRGALGWKIGNGSETVVNITTTGGTTTDAIKCAVHRFTAANGFAAVPVQGLNTRELATASTTANMPTVTPSGVNERAVCLVCVGGAVTIAAATGETGGDWTKPTAEDSTGSVHAFGIQTSDQSGGGVISGGGASLGGNVVWTTAGITLVPALI